MGYIKHHVIVVVAWEQEDAIHAGAKAQELGLDITSVVPSRANGYTSFMVVPDGSKEWWPTSDAGDAKRIAYVEWLRTQRGLDWAEVELDVDGDAARLPHHKWTTS
jgi:hypothetical protein